MKKEFILIKSALHNLGNHKIQFADDAHRFIIINIIKESHLVRIWLAFSIIICYFVSTTSV